MFVYVFVDFMYMIDCVIKVIDCFFFECFFNCLDIVIGVVFLSVCDVLFVFCFKLFDIGY